MRRSLNSVGGFGMAEASSARAYAVYSFIEASRLRFGAEGIAAIVDALDEARAAELRELSGPSAWAPLRLYFALYRAATRELYDCDPEGAFELSRIARRLEIRGLFQSLGFSEGAGAAIASLRLIRRHHFNGGKLELRHEPSGRLKAVLSAMPEMDAVVANEFAGSIAGYLDMSHVRGVRVHDLQYDAERCAVWIDYRKDRAKLLSRSAHSVR